MGSRPVEKKKRRQKRATVTIDLDGDVLMDGTLTSSNSPKFQGSNPHAMAPVPKTKSPDSIDRMPHGAGLDLNESTSSVLPPLPSTPPAHRRTSPDLSPSFPSVKRRIFCSPSSPQQTSTEDRPGRIRGLGIISSPNAGQPALALSENDQIKKGVNSMKRVRFTPFTPLFMGTGESQQRSDAGNRDDQTNTKKGHHKTLQISPPFVIYGDPEVSVGEEDDRTKKGREDQKTLQISPVVVIYENSKFSMGKGDDRMEDKREDQKTLQAQSLLEQYESKSSSHTEMRDDRIEKVKRQPKEEPKTFAKKKDNKKSLDLGKKDSSIRKKGKQNRKRAKQKNAKKKMRSKQRAEMMMRMQAKEIENVEEKKQLSAQSSHHSDSQTATATSQLHSHSTAVELASSSQNASSSLPHTQQHPVHAYAAKKSVTSSLNDADSNSDTSSDSTSDSETDVREELFAHLKPNAPTSTLLALSYACRADVDSGRRDSEDERLYSPL